MATCVINTINLCRSMLETQKVRSSLIEIAKEFSATNPIAIFPQEASPENEGEFSRITDVFLQKIHADFPLVWVDFTCANPDRMASYVRRPWEGDFKSSNQIIQLNGDVGENRADFRAKGA